MGESGYIVPVGSVRAIKNKVSCLLNNPELLGKFGDEARKVAERNLDIKICAEKHLSAYKKIISLWVKKKIMFILGINAYHGDSSACIVKDGVLLAAVEEERYTRIKH